VTLKQFKRNEKPIVAASSREKYRGVTHRPSR